MCVSVNVFVYVGIYCVCSCTCVCNCIQCIAVSRGCVSQNVCISCCFCHCYSLVEGRGWWPEKLSMKTKREEGTKALPWAWAIQTCPQVKKNEGTDDLHPLRSLLLEPHTPGPFLRPTPSRTCWPVLSDTYHSHAASVRRPHPQPSPWLPSWEAGKRRESKAAGLGRVSLLPAPHPGATSSPQLLRPNSTSS